MSPLFSGQEPFASFSGGLVMGNESLFAPALILSIRDCMLGADSE